MTKTDAVTADGNVLDGIKVSPHHGLVPGIPHQVRMEGPDFLEPEPDVAGNSKLDKFFRRPSRSRSSIDQRRMNLLVNS